MFGQVLGRDKGFLVAIEFFWFCVATGVPCAAAWLSGLMQLQGRDIVFPCRDSVVLLCRDRGFPVATEMVTTRGKVLQPSYCNKFGLG